MSAEPQYIITVEELEPEATTVLAAPLAGDDADYFLAFIKPNLTSLSRDAYSHGPAIFLHTFARYSYVLYDSEVYWITEWSPGLVVVCFSPSGQISWGAFRSRVPNFGGRTPDPEDYLNYSEDDPDPQYNLVFCPWDSQFDAQHRKWNNFSPADDATIEAYRKALDLVNTLGEELRKLYGEDDARFLTWSELCKANLALWAGTGLRFNPKAD